MTAFWAPHAVGARPTWGADTKPGTPVRGVGAAPVPGFLASYRTTDLGGKVEKMHANPSILEKSIICLIRVRGFPLRHILSLRALGDGLGQGRKIVGAPSPPSASIC